MTILLAHARAGSRRVGLTIVLFAIVPMLILSVASWRNAADNPGLPQIEPGNVAAVKQLAATFIHTSAHADSWSPMRQASQVAAGPDHGRLYEKLFFGDLVRFQYPPSSLLWTETLARFGVSSDQNLNRLNSAAMAANAGLMAVLAWVLFRREPVRPGAIRANPAVMALLAALASFVFYPVVRAHLLGQIQLWIDLLFTGAVLAWVMKRRGIAGVLIGLACTIKPQLGLLLAWALLWREWRFVVGAVLVLVPIECAALFKYGMHNHLAYLQVLGFLSRHGESYFANNSVNGILNWYLSGQDSLHWYDAEFTPYRPLVYAGTLAASLLFYGLLLVQPIINRARRPDAADLGAAAICTIAGAPVAWEHHYGLLLPLFLLVLRRLMLTSPSPARGLAGAATLGAWVLTADFLPFVSGLAGTALVVAQAYCFFGALLLLAVLLWPWATDAEATMTVIGE